jgi:hypothetical protein
MAFAGSRQVPQLGQGDLTSPAAAADCVGGQASPQAGATEVKAGTVAGVGFFAAVRVNQPE